MFNFTAVLLSVVNGAVVDKPTSDFTGHSATVQITPSEERFELIFLLIIVFLAGMFTHHAYVKIKDFLAKDEPFDEYGEDENEDEENKDENNLENNNENSTNSQEYKNNRKLRRK